MRMLERRLVRQPDPVSSSLINVQIERHTDTAQRASEIETVFHRHHRVFVRVKNETGRRVLRDLQFV